MRKREIANFVMFLVTGTVWAHEIELADKAKIAQFQNMTSDKYKTLADTVGKCPISNAQCYYVTSPFLFDRDILLGHKNKASIDALSSLRTDQKLIYSVSYHTEKYGLRLTKNTEGEKSEFVALFGDSFVFGTGLNTDETLSSLLASKIPDKFEVYNFGLISSGVNHLLAFSNDDLMLKGAIRQKIGHFIYVYSDWQINRAMGYWPEAEGLKESPSFNEETMVYEGTLWENTSYFRKIVYKTLKKLNLIKLVSNDYCGLSEHDYQYTCNLITKSRENFLSLFPGSKFSFYQHKVGQQCDLNETLRKCLSINKIDIWQEKLSFDERDWIENDGHPTKMCNEKISKTISQYLLAHEN